MTYRLTLPSGTEIVRPFATLADVFAFIFRLSMVEGFSSRDVKMERVQ
jgi:hypothetical protein